MPFHVEFRPDGDVIEWPTATADDEPTVHTGYTPRFHVAPRTPETEGSLESLRAAYERHPSVAGTAWVERRPGFRHAPTTVLAVDCAHVDRVRPLAAQSRRLADVPVGELACYDVDLSPGFRYCLDRGLDPTPTGELATLRLGPAGDGEGVGQPTDGTAEPRPLTTLAIDGEQITGQTAMLDRMATVLADRDPDVLICTTARLVPRLAATADAQDRADFSLGRRPGADGRYRRLAGASTYTSYGQVGQSPARYDIPGRAVIDESNAFFYHEAGLDGVRDLVGRARKPLQELAWASIGNVLTAIQIRAARDRDVLVPWRAWRHERFKSFRTLHDADRGGFVLAPAVGLHEDVHELDFASLYPNIIRTRNVSPETVRCDCHRDRADVPGLEYAICDEQGYLPEVLGPLIDARATYKTERRRERARDEPSQDRLDTLDERIAALKWLLVACFGYQGFDNAKFGRIECHEAINAFAREILLTAKEHLETGGWRVLHGIVDSVWVTPDPAVADADRTDLETLAAEITATVGIELEYEAAYDWVAFVPRRDSTAGALTRYFGRVRGTDEYKIRGIAARQRSTAPFVATVQRDCLRRLDEHRDADAVIDRLRTALARLDAGEVDPDRLIEQVRTTRPLAGYERASRTVAALERARDRGRTVRPGQDVRYVVVDDDRSGRDRVRLASEPVERYDAAHYAAQLKRAVTSVLAPLGWTREDVTAALGDTHAATLAGFERIER